MNNIGIIDITYSPKALFYHEADVLEYVRKDIPSFSRRIDDILTLVMSSYDKKVIGFRIKGFKHIYFRHFGKADSSEVDFVRMVTILERVATELLSTSLSETANVDAYQTASQIADEDNVIVNDLPIAS